MSSSGVREDSEKLRQDMVAFLDQNLKAGKNLRGELTLDIGAHSVRRHTLPRVLEQRGLSLRSDSMVNEFVKVKCTDCGNEQITFRKASMDVKCNVCGTILVKPRGGNADIKGEIVEVFN